LVYDLKQGDTIEFWWIENRSYGIITSLRKASSKDDQIIRMSCPSSASRLISGIGINPRKRKKLSLQLAKESEEYVEKGESNSSWEFILESIYLDLLAGGCLS